jgi:hypothetical protein
MTGYIDKCECIIHSLKKEGENGLGEATIIIRLGDSVYLAEYVGVQCHAMFNPFLGRYVVDDVDGIIKEPAPG